VVLAAPTPIDIRVSDTDRHEDRNDKNLLSCRADDFVTDPIVVAENRYAPEARAETKLQLGSSAM
jgi:hypothetical protein